MPSRRAVTGGADNPEAQRAFSVRMLQNALFDRGGNAIDSVFVSRFQQLGLFRDVIPPDVIDTTVDAIRDPKNVTRVQSPEGPLLFVREEKAVSVFEPASLLLHPRNDVRAAVLRFISHSGATPHKWLTEHTVEVLAKCKAQIEDTEIGRWRPSAIEVVLAVRGDLFAHLAGLKQSLYARYQPGVNQFLPLVLHPTFDMLAHVRPPLWGASEQIAEIEKWCADDAARPSLAEALDGYYDKCGCVPLRNTLSAAELCRKWMELHPTTEIKWSDVWQWAEGKSSPLAKYHAMEIALRVPELAPVSPEADFWEELIHLLDVAIPAECRKSYSRWQLLYELTSHYTRHVETLHPRQSGERVACYGLWLAKLVAEILGSTEERAKFAIEHACGVDVAVSRMRWTIGRSPTTPSPLRYSALYIESLWSMSLLAQICATHGSALMQLAPQDTSSQIGRVLVGYSYATPIANRFENDPQLYAFQESGTITNVQLLRHLMRTEDFSKAEELSRSRDLFDNPAELERKLVLLPELPPHEQFLTTVYLRDAVFSSGTRDDAIAGWLSASDRVLESLDKVPYGFVDAVLEALGEFQQRYRGDYPIRLPHLVACAVENTTDVVRARGLFTHLLLMSINGGIVSPIQRVMMSGKWKSEFVKPLTIWRANICDVARLSEPWIGARVRTVNAAISRLIGPRGNTPDEEGQMGPDDSQPEAVPEPPAS